MRIVRGGREEASQSLELERGANEKKRGKTRGSRLSRRGGGGFDSCRGALGQWERSAGAMFGPACAPIGGLDGPRDGGANTPGFLFRSCLALLRFFKVNHSNQTIAFSETEPVPYSKA